MVFVFKINKIVRYLKMRAPMFQTDAHDLIQMHGLQFIQGLSMQMAADL